MYDDPGVQSIGVNSSCASPQAGANHRLATAGIVAVLLLMPMSAPVLLGQSISESVFPLYVTPGLFLSDLALAAAMVPAIFSIRRRTRSHSILGWPLLGLAITALGLAPLAAHPPFAIYSAARWGLAWLIFWLFSRTQVATESLVRVFVLPLTVQSLFGLGQVIVRGPLGLPGELALPADQWGAAVIETGGMPFLRAYGLAFHPNVLAGFLVVGMLVGLPLTRRKAMRFAWWILGIGLALSFSRSAWLAMTLTIPAAVWWIVRHRPGLLPAVKSTLVVLALSLLVIVAAVARPFLTRFQPTQWLTERQSLVNRLSIGQYALEAIGTAPLAGVGAGHFPAWVAEHHPQAVAEPVHNVVLLLTAEVGFLGMLLGLALFTGPLLVIIRHWEDLNQWAILFLLASVALGLIGLADSYPWSLNAGRELMAFTLGVSARESAPELSG